ncbi:MAG: hypothetical protein KJI71_00235 [Patescibacteria group bacterium]|nr:hypothetical protein [Patescibacteria group bacterium]
MVDPDITSDRILSLISDQWLTKADIAYKLGIKHSSDRKYLTKKIEELNRTERLISLIYNDWVYWKRNNSESIVELKISFCLAILDEDPFDAELWYKLGNQYLEYGGYDMEELNIDLIVIDTFMQSKKCYKNALSVVDPEINLKLYFDILLNLAVIYVMLGEPDKAQSQIDFLLEIEEEFEVDFIGEMYKKLAQVYLNKADYNQALHYATESHMRLLEDETLEIIFHKIDIEKKKEEDSTKKDLTLELSINPLDHQELNDQNLDFLLQEEILAKWKKETDNKIVWVAQLEGVEFKLYIPKWRIPQPDPEEILIKIYSPSEKVGKEEFITKDDIQLNPKLKNNTIYSDIHRISEHTQTIRFDPDGDRENWEIGSPYIPKSILKGNNIDKLSIAVEWLSENVLEKPGAFSAQEDSTLSKSTQGEEVENLFETNQHSITKDGNLKITRKNVLTVIDGPNSFGEDYKDQLDLEKVADYSHDLDKNAGLYYFTKTTENYHQQTYLSRIGYKVQPFHKDIDYALRDLIREKLNSNQPPTLILLGAKDQDYTGFIKQIRREFNIEIKLVISSEKGLSNSLKRSFKEEDILKFPKEMKMESRVRESVFTFLEGDEGRIISKTQTGKICLPDRAGNFQPNVGEKWICKIKKEFDSSIILTLIKKIG